VEEIPPGFSFPCIFIDMNRDELKALIKECILESNTIDRHSEVKNLTPVHGEDVSARFFSHPDFSGWLTVINGTHIPLKVTVERMTSPEHPDKQYNLITLTTDAKESVVNQIVRMLKEK
jgi:hypothetical protein